MHWTEMGRSMPWCKNIDKFFRIEWITTKGQKALKFGFNTKTFEFDVLATSLTVY